MQGLELGLGLTLILPPPLASCPRRCHDLTHPRRMNIITHYLAQPVPVLVSTVVLVVVLVVMPAPVPSQAALYLVVPVCSRRHSAPPWDKGSMQPLLVLVLVLVFVLTVLI